MRNPHRASITDVNFYFNGILSGKAKHLVLWTNEKRGFATDLGDGSTSLGRVICRMQSKSSSIADSEQWVLF